MKNEIYIKGQKISVEEFKQVCIDLYTLSNIAQHYGCVISTISGKIKEAFPGLPNNYRTPIGYKLLALEGKMKCYVCKEIYSYDFYHVNTHNKNGLSKECKSCCSIRNTSQKVRDQKKRYRDSTEGRSIRRAGVAKRRASKQQRTPIWSETEEIKEFYKNCPEGYHVDHIIPLQGERVSGFHVLSNLQYLPAEENLSKSNKYEV